MRVAAGAIAKKYLDEKIKYKNKGLSISDRSLEDYLH